MSSPARTIYMLAIAMLAMSARTIAADTAWHKPPPQRTPVNSILRNQNRPGHPATANSHAPSKPAASKHKTDQQLRAEVRAIERDGTGYISPARQRALDQQASKSGTPSEH